MSMTGTDRHTDFTVWTMNQERITTDPLFCGVPSKRPEMLHIGDTGITVTYPNGSCSMIPMHNIALIEITA